MNKIIAGHLNLEGLTEDDLVEPELCEFTCSIKDSYCTKEYQVNCAAAKFYKRYKEEKK